jgi:hypothetical protein
MRMMSAVEEARIMVNVVRLRPTLTEIKMRSSGIKGGKGRGA